MAEFLTTHTRHVAFFPPVTRSDPLSAIAKQVTVSRYSSAPDPTGVSLVLGLTRSTRTRSSQYPQLMIDSAEPSDGTCNPKLECTRPILRAGTVGIAACFSAFVFSTFSLPKTSPHRAGSTSPIVSPVDARSWDAGKPSSSSGRAGKLVTGTCRLGNDVCADTLLMCSDRDGSELVLQEPSVKGRPRPFGSPLHVHVVTRSEASTATRRSSVQYTSSADWPSDCAGLCLGEKTCGSRQVTLCGYSGQSAATPRSSSSLLSRFRSCRSYSSSFPTHTWVAHVLCYILRARYFSWRIFFEAESKAIAWNQAGFSELRNNTCIIANMLMLSSLGTLECDIPFGCGA